MAFKSLYNPPDRLFFFLINAIQQEIKQGFLAQKQAEVVAKNVRLMIEGGRECRRETYKPHSVLAIVSLGRNDAVAQFPFLTLSGRIPGIIKSGDLFVGKTRKLMGLSPHIV